ncbi:hypothetical protein GJ700_21870 [Duganella sp. FT92W]|uniref:Toxin-activating lysine-acyltransferase n=1 Tax=Pseudoduganella rivuli TaxID=2666085 RepID=A0A7X2IQY0_9BURK|nr:hypothetical protein [Pseudoduganella rivuli]MRV74359.1 hypothetical protein [Pseudoduganella rivuli]
MSQANDNLHAILAVRCELQLDTPHATLQALRNCAQSGTFDVLHNELGRANGYVAWADINKESWRALCERGRLPSYAFEWNEGRLLLLLDIALARAQRHALRTSLERLFATRRAVVFLRRGCVHIYARSQGRMRLVARRRFDAAAPAEPGPN